MILGSIHKDHAEAARFSINLAEWLDEGEAIYLLSQFSVIVDDAELATAWQVDYPFTASTELPGIVDDPDTTLLLVSSAIASDVQADVLVGAGTPGVTYLVSFIAEGSTSGRKKQVDFNVIVNAQTNDEMAYGG